MRGKQWGGKKPASLKRITPAHAGKTSKLRSPSFLPTDHPRACGENQLNLDAWAPESGSPPRMRGKHDALLCSRVALRITPAHAGKTEGYT